MQAWPLTGRAEELEVIADVFRADGPHAGVLIAGSAGVGKTRLAREAMAAARNCGWAVHWVAGTVAAQSIPLGHSRNGPTGSKAIPCSWWAA